MNTDNRYNGWTNYATWRVNLEMFNGNDFDDWCDLKTCEPYELEQQLRDYADDIVTEFGELEGLAVDYARAFLSDVNWYEIAQHIIDNAKAEAA
jgi:hypothetical protein